MSSSSRQGGFKQSTAAEGRNINCRLMSAATVCQGGSGSGTCTILQTQNVADALKCGRTPAYKRLWHVEKLCKVSGSRAILRDTVKLSICVVVTGFEKRCMLRFFLCL